MSPMTAAAIFRDPANPRASRLFLLAARPSKCGTFYIWRVQRDREGCVYVTVFRSVSEAGWLNRVKK